MNFDLTNQHFRNFDREAQLYYETIVEQGFSLHAKTFEGMTYTEVRDEQQLVTRLLSLHEASVFACCCLAYVDRAKDKLYD